MRKFTALERQSLIELLKTGTREYLLAGPCSLSCLLPVLPAASTEPRGAAL